MKELFYNELAKLKSWLQTAIAAGWLRDSALVKLAEIETKDADNLFKSQKYRPLTVAFFGGTGVGKSSLLNRLAKQNLAKVSIERPTSNEVSLYLHKDFELGQLPDELPVAKTEVFYHAQDKFKLLGFIDMPDVDSTTEENRQLVKKWLPYIDYLVYVVTPERYLDAAAWQILDSRKDQHGLLFIMNHWDQAQEKQLDSFVSHLTSHGIKNPQVLRTSCKKPYVEDDFAKLIQFLNQAIEQYGLELLQSLGLKDRLQKLHKLKNAFLADLTTETWDEQDKLWFDTVTTKLNELGDCLNVNKNLSIEQNLRGFTIDSGFLSWLRSKNDKTEINVSELTQSIWQDRNTGQMQHLNLQLQNNLQKHNLAYKPFAAGLNNLQQIATDEALAIIEQQLGHSLQKPGNLLGRFFYKSFGALSWILPLAAAGWVLWHLLETFYLAGKNQGAYLELNFVSHSLMLIFIMWLVPKIIHHKLAPSYKKTIDRGLSRGIKIAIENLKDSYQDLWQQKVTEKSELISKAV